MSLTATLDQVQASLIAGGIGQNTDSKAPWMIYKGSMPDSDLNQAPLKTINDQAICLYELSGIAPLEAWLIDYPGVQVMVRGAPDGYTECRTKIQEIYLRLHATESALNTAAGAVDWVYFYATHSGPIIMGMDKKRRMRLAWNFRSMRNRVDS